MIMVILMVVIKIMIVVVTIIMMEPVKRMMLVAPVKMVITMGTNEEDDCSGSDDGNVICENCVDYGAIGDNGDNEANKRDDGGNKDNEGDFNLDDKSEGVN